MMSGIKSKNTKPEVRVRKLLHQEGFRFRLHQKKLPGCPDLVMPKYKLCVFIHGCFWHHHEGCKYAYTPKTRRDFWQKKFKDNSTRDQKCQLELINSGWRVMIIWECFVNSNNKFQLIESIVNGVESDCKFVELP